MGKLYLVGMGPGNEANMTGAARAALEEAEILCGYTKYVELLKPLFPGKIFYATGMTAEVERCQYCLARAAEGLCAALVCSGDAGVYGMASPVLELAEEYPGVEIVVIPGVTAAVSGAALLGAPLGHDFCVISLSDRLTDWNVIETRLRCAAEGDFSVCRQGERIRILTLKELRDAEADMFSTVFIGSSSTKRIGGRMVTPRGYKK